MTERERERCGGASLPPLQNTIKYRILKGGFSFPVRGACRHCGKETALTSAGNIREHIPAKRVSDGA